VIGVVFRGGATILGMALLSGFFMFLMRQTIIVMSRHIEFDQKNEIFNQYQRLSTEFFRANFTGDLMNRISEDVSRVRNYTGPAIMYLFQAVFITAFCIYEMLNVNISLTGFVLIPLPFLAFSIYYVNQVIFRKSSRIQEQLSGLTTTAQESYSGIRVIKSFVEEQNMMRFFNSNSENYRQSAISLSLTEAIYFPSMTFFIGLSQLCTILIGGLLAIKGDISVGNIAQFVFYINLLIFPISAIGMIASMMQRAGASQKRIDEFLQLRPTIVEPEQPASVTLTGEVSLRHTGFTYANTGIVALRDINLEVKPGGKIAIIGKTGSGKSTMSHLLLRMYDATAGKVMFDGTDVRDMQPAALRRQIAYTPQEALLFSDTIYNNIRFGNEHADREAVMEAARLADLDKDIANLAAGYETVIGERGVMLSGGQKQRLVLARALLKNSRILILDECLSAVDTQTEKTILGNLKPYLEDKTVFVITHRIFTGWTFDQIIVLDDGAIAERGTHDELVARNGHYARLFAHQTSME
jgi:ATP-binding cassette subfamily B protein